MKRHAALSLILSMLIVGIVSNGFAQTPSIHDVKIMGEAVSGSPAPDPNNNNCVSLVIGAVGGTSYPSTSPVVTIFSADGQNPAKVLAIEEGNNCYGQGSDANRDRLILWNTVIKPTNASGVNTDLTIEVSADFSLRPDDSVLFGGHTEGTFKRVGTNKPVTCIGATPPNGPCKVTDEGWIHSNLDGMDHYLGAVTRTNPTNGSVKADLPGDYVDVGQQLSRGHRLKSTVRLPSTDHKLEFKGDITQGIRHPAPPPPKDEKKKR